LHKVREGGSNTAWTLAAAVILCIACVFRHTTHAAQRWAPAVPGAAAARTHAPAVRRHRKPRPPSLRGCSARGGARSQRSRHTFSAQTRRAHDAGRAGCTPARTWGSKPAPAAQAQRSARAPERRWVRQRRRREKHRCSCVRARVSTRSRAAGTRLPHAPRVARTPGCARRPRRGDDGSSFWLLFQTFFGFLATPPPPWPTARNRAHRPSTRCASRTAGR